MAARLPQQIKHYCYDSATHSPIHTHTHSYIHKLNYICILMAYMYVFWCLFLHAAINCPSCKCISCSYMQRSQSQCQFRFSCRVLSVIGCEIYSSKVHNYVELTLVLLLLNKLSSSNGWQKQEGKLQLQQVDELIYLLFIQKSSLNVYLPVIHMCKILSS